MTRKLSLTVVLPVLSVFCLVSALGLHYHELFLDEAHHFLIARDSNSVMAIHHNLRYDGHPLLWHLLLFLITHYITIDPAGMQVLQFLLSAAAAFLLLRYAPFGLAVKILILLGYYFIFEYNLLSRNYALGILLLFLCCHLLREAEKHLAAVGAVLILLCNTHVFFTMASIGLFLFVTIRYRGRRRFARYRAFAGLFLVGLICALIQARVQVVDNANMIPVKPGEWLSVGNFVFAAFGLVRGWLPVPQVNGGHFWNTYWINESHFGVVTGGLLFLFFLLFPAALLRKQAPALVFYYSTVVMMLVFFVVTQMKASRYFGMVYIFFLVAAWLMAEGGDGSTEPDGADGPGRAEVPIFSPASIPGPWWVRRLFLVTLGVVMVIQAGVGLFALEQEFSRPFSQSKNTVEYLKHLSPAERPIVVDGYNSGPMLCAYLEGKVFYLATDAPGSFCVWKKEYFPRPRPAIGAEIAACRDIRNFGEFILVANRAEDTRDIHSAAGNYRLTPLRSFTNSIIGEDYYVYRVDPIRE